VLNEVYERARRSPISKIILGVLIGLLLFAIWQSVFVSHANGPLWSFMQGNSEMETQIPALQRAGVFLAHAAQQADLSQQQALLLANQLEPIAAVNAQHIDARYILLDYPVNNGSTGQQRFTDQPAWLIWYQHVPVQANDPAVDASALSQPQQDLFVFIDDHSGKELLALYA
jgi:hypothetical protein